MKESILTGSALIILLILLRRALRGRISPRVQYTSGCWRRPGC